MFNKKKILIIAILVIILSCVQLCAASDVATVHGAVYEWNSFQPLDNVIVEINTTPPQSMLARYGLYSFKLAPGNYLITASYYRNGVLLAYTEEELTITDDGDYVVDLLLFPAHDKIPVDDDFSDLDYIADILDNEDKTGVFHLYTQLSIVLILLIVTISIYYLVYNRRSAYKRKKIHRSDHSVSGALDTPTFGSDTSVSSISASDGPGSFYSQDKHHSTDNEDVNIEDENINHSSEKTYNKLDLKGLPEDLIEVLVIIEKNDGRITQKDLRSKLRHSEAKVSLMVSDLEDRGLIRKFKKGRGNVIILGDKEDTNQNV